MGATYMLFSPLSPKEMLELEGRVQQLVEEYCEEHPECYDEWGEMSVGGSIQAEEVIEEYRSLGLTLAPELVDRVSRCRSAFIIDRPGDIEMLGGLQVSILRFVLKHIGEGLAFLNDYPLESSERLLTYLKKKRGVTGFGRQTSVKLNPRKVARRDAKPGEVRALRVLGTLEKAMTDVHVAIDVKAALRAVSEAARNYGVLLLEEGAISDAKAAKTLGKTCPELAAAADELDQALARSLSP